MSDLGENDGGTYLQSLFVCFLLHFVLVLPYLAAAASSQQVKLSSVKLGLLVKPRKIMLI